MVATIRWKNSKHNKSPCKIRTTRVHKRRLVHERWSRSVLRRCNRPNDSRPQIFKSKTIINSFRTTLTWSQTSGGKWTPSDTRLLKPQCFLKWVSSFNLPPGMDGWFFARIDYQDREQRLKDASLEMVMSPYQASGVSQKILAHAQFWGYYPVPGFCWDYRDCTDQPI